MKWFSTPSFIFPEGKKNEGSKIQSNFLYLLLFFNKRRPKNMKWFSTPSLFFPKGKRTKAQKYELISQP